MRTVVSFLIFCAQAAHAGDLFVERGFRANQCYTHFGKLRCADGGPCVLDLFGGAAALSFSTDIRDLKHTLRNAPAAIYSFRVHANGGKTWLEILTETRSRNAPKGESGTSAQPAPCP